MYSGIVLLRSIRMLNMLSAVTHSGSVEHFHQHLHPPQRNLAKTTAIWKSKPLKTEGAGALLEVEVGKICTTPARENDLEVKIAKK